MSTPARRRLGLGLSIACAIALLGCQASSSSAPAASTAASTAASAAPSSAAPSSVAPSTAASSTPVASAAPLPLCADNTGPGCPLAPGTYTTAPFEAAFTFTIVSEWQNDRAWPHGGEIALANGAVQWASGVKVGVVEGVNVAIGPTPEDFVAHMRKTKGYTVSGTSPVTIDGVSGVQIDVLTNKTGIHGIFKIEEDNFNLDPGEKIRLYVLDKDGQTVILTMDSFKAAGFDDFAAVAQPVIDSVNWLP